MQDALAQELSEHFASHQQELRSPEEATWFSSFSALTASEIGAYFARHPHDHTHDDLEVIH